MCLEQNSKSVLNLTHPHGCSGVLFAFLAFIGAAVPEGGLTAGGKGRLQYCYFPLLKGGAALNSSQDSIVHWDPASFPKIRYKMNMCCINTLCWCPGPAMNLVGFRSLSSAGDVKGWSCPFPASAGFAAARYHDPWLCHKKMNGAPYLEMWLGRKNAWWFWTWLRCLLHIVMSSFAQGG